MVRHCQQLHPHPTEARLQTDPASSEYQRQLSNRQSNYTELSRLGGAEISWQGRPRDCGTVYVTECRGHRYHKNLSKDRNALAPESWDDKYPTSEPGEVVTFGLQYILQDKDTRLGSIMTQVDQMAPGRSGMVTRFLFGVRRILLCSVEHDLKWEFW